ncbi:hypothetical protein, partial [Bacillus paralicheniformis]|uniref:hypothetical protein n=1 Tax=Bacillus paralicheniformis TaxID=1648923 RepID=UPI00196B7959
SQKAGELDLEKSNSPAFSSKKQNKLDKNRSDYKNPTYFVNSLENPPLGGFFSSKHNVSDIKIKYKKFFAIF